MNKMFRRLVVYLLGLWILAFGVAISVNGNLGVSPVNSLPYVMSLITGVALGNCVIVVFVGYILIQILIMRREFEWRNLGQILCSTVFGYFVDLSKAVLGDFALPSYPGRLLMLAVSIVFVAAGMCLYMSVNLMNMPMEGLTAAISKKVLKKMSFHEVKVIIDCTVVGIGIVLSLLFLGELKGIREGTVLSALLIGKVMKQIQKRCIPAVKRFCLMDAELNQEALERV